MLRTTWETSGGNIARGAQHHSFQTAIPFIRHPQGVLCCSRGEKRILAQRSRHISSARIRIRRLVQWQQVRGCVGEERHPEIFCEMLNESCEILKGFTIAAEIRSAFSCLMLSKHTSVSLFVCVCVCSEVSNIEDQSQKPNRPAGQLGGHDDR